MTDVHRLGDVGSREIDHHGAARTDGRHAERRVVKECLGVARVGLRQDAEVDEARSGDVGGRQSVEVEVADDFLGEFARVGAALFGQHHRGVGLVVAEAQVGRGGDRGAVRVAEGCSEGVGEPGFEFLEEGHGDGLRCWGCRRDSGIRSWRAAGFGVQDVEDFLAGCGSGEAAPHVAVGEHFRDRREGAKVEVVVLARDDEEDDQVDGCLVDRLEIDTRLRAAEHRNDLVEIVGEGMGDRDTRADAGAHLFFAGEQGVDGCIPQGHGKQAAQHQVVDQFGDRRSLVGSLHFGKDPVGGDQVRQLHGTQPGLRIGRRG